MSAFLKGINAISRGTTLYRDEKFREYGLKGSQIKYLFAVFSAPGVSQDELACRLLVNKSNVARQVAALEEGGFVRREQSAEDKRVWRVFPSSSAERVMSAVRAANEEWKARLLEGLTAAERAELERLISVVEANVRSTEGER